MLWPSGRVKMKQVGARDCDNEPIHNIGGVQAHGCLLTFNREFRIENVSGNAKDFLQTGPSSLIGLKIHHVLPAQLVNQLERAVREHPWPASYGRHLESDWDAYLFFTDELFCLELEQKPPELKLDMQVTLKEFVLQSKRSESLTQLSQLTSRVIREVTGMERVMVYKFLPPEMHGEVIAEDRVAGAHSYLGHRFPASDIPHPARRLYLRNQVRLIPNVEASTYPISPSVHPSSRQPLDLSDSRLRAVAPVHLEYLRNMGVRASFSLSITAEEDLWGLIACHNSQPMQVSQSARTLCEIIAHTFAGRAIHLERAQNLNRRLEFEKGLRRWLEEIGRAQDFESEFVRRHTRACDLFSAGGLAVIRHERCDFSGSTPPPTEIVKIRDALLEKSIKDNQNVVALTSLGEVNEEWNSFRQLASGALAVTLDSADRSMLIFFRPELVRTIVWGGDPRKQLDKRNFPGALNPRRSFEAWTVVVHGHSLEWDLHERDGALFLKQFFFGLMVPNNRIIRELSRKFVQEKKF